MYRFDDDVRFFALLSANLIFDQIIFLCKTEGFLYFAFGTCMYRSYLEIKNNPERLESTPVLNDFIETK